MAGLLGRLFGTAAPPAVREVEATLYEGNETLEVVGESHHQDTLWALAGGRRTQRVECKKIAVLLPDPDNEYDENAIEVRIDGLPVGYLSAENAARYHRGLLQLMERSANRLVALQATIVGGGLREDGLGFLGVFLSHDPTDFGLQRGTSRAGGFRTGFSEASATDLDDDRYDLSWSWNLAGDDAIAAGQLSELLKSIHDPIDRHYIYCELERRLYRCRNTVATALDDFDTACRSHDAEMNEIRPLLLDKFGVIPVIDMYRQATIQCEKAKQWEAARHWAERGISVYGDQAARPEVVEDLRKRVAHAIARSETAERPRPRKPRGATVPTASERTVEMESLVCSACGTTFQRVRTRGRKPRLCSSCRVGAPPA